MQQTRRGRHVGLWIEEDGTGREERGAERHSICRLRYEPRLKGSDRMGLGGVVGRDWDLVRVEDRSLANRLRSSSLLEGGRTIRDSRKGS